MINNSDVVDKLVRSSAVDVIVVDSVAALVPRAELEGDMSDSQIGLQARLMSKAMRKITGSLSASQCTVVFLNQLRSKVRNSSTQKMECQPQKTTK
jgi:recombination protein RecA